MSEVNRLLWDERAPAHAASPQYGLARYPDDPDHLSDVVRFDLRRLGGISVVGALLNAGMAVTGLTEHDSVPWNARPGEMTESDGEWRMRDRPERFPCTYTLQARKA